MEYQYVPLTTPPGASAFSIRLLHLLPATDRSVRLECRLLEACITSHLQEHSISPLDVTSKRVKYQALSYAWGEPIFSEALHVNQEDGSTPAGTISITKNLYLALQILRKTENTLVIWVDAVCIDQTNVPELNSQVENFSLTYGAAESVLVWLGDDKEHDGRFCLEFFSEMAVLLNGELDDGPRDDRASWRRRFQINQTVSIFLNSAQPRYITTFLSRPWFRRRWVIQEVVLANEVFVHCGASSVPWSTFELALTELYENDKGGFSEDNRTTLRTMSRIRNSSSGAKRQTPLATLVEFSTFECADPRDRLYALYGIMQHWFPGPPHKSQTGSVDYALSIAEVFTSFAILMMKMNTLVGLIYYNPTAHVLQLASTFRQDTASRNRLRTDETGQRIPSWVPDWTGSLVYKPLDHSPSNRDASSSIPKHRPNIIYSSQRGPLLAFTGLICDTITANIHFDVRLLLGAAYKAKDALNDFLSSVARELDQTGFLGTADNLYHPTGEHLIIALATALVANWEYTPTNSYFAQDHRFSDDFLKHLATSKHHLPEILHKWPAYVELVAIRMKGRGLFLTEAGYMGICADDVQAGDKVCILSGIKIPFILRPRGCTSPSKMDDITIHDSSQSQSCASSQEHDTYELKGDTYVHGLMNGQGVEKFAIQNFGPRLEDALVTLKIE